MIVAERAARIAAQAELSDARAEAANAQADLTSSEALIAHLKLAIEKLRRELYGTRSERKARLLDQMELKLEELEAAASEDEQAARAASTEAVALSSASGPRAARFRTHLPRERVVIAAPQTLPVLRFGTAVEARRGHDRDAGGDPAPLEGDPDRARALQLPRLRDDHAAPCTLPRHAARLCRTEPACHNPVREVRSASAAQSAERALWAGGHRPQRLDARRSSRRLRDGPATAVRADRGSRSVGSSACTATTPRCRSSPRARP